MSTPTTQTPAPTQQQPTTPAPTTAAPATAAPAAAAPAAALTPEQAKKKAEEAQQQLMGILNNGPLGILMKALGFDPTGKGAAPMDAATKAATSFFGDITSKIVVITPDDERAGYKKYDGKVETVEHNLRVALQKMFDDKKLVFDADPAKNKAEFDLLLKDASTFARQAVPKSGAYEPAKIIEGLTARAKELGTDITVRLENKLQTPADKIVGADIMYGEKLRVDGKSPASIAAIGLKDNSINIHRMVGNGQLISEGTVTMDQLKKILGDDITVQTYNHKHNDPVDLPKGAKPPIDGYYVSNGKGQGFFIGVDEISPATTKVDLSMTPERVAAATPTPAVAPNQNPTVAAPTAGG